jgi:hypothetical protein
MFDLGTGATMLGSLLEETRGVVGVALGTTEGEVRATAGSVEDADASAAVAASLTNELNHLGALLGLGELGVASLKAANAARVFARQANATVMIEVDPRRSLGELETKLRTTTWAPDDDIIAPSVNRVPTVPRPDHSDFDLGGWGDSQAAPLPLPPPLPPAHALIARPTPPPGNLLPRVPPPTPPPTPSAHGRATPPPIPAVPAPTKAVGTGPVFTGDLEEFHLPDLLEFLRNTHRTGLLMCTAPQGEGTVQMSRGMIIGADSPNAVNLREHFVTDPEIDADRRRAIASAPAEWFDDDRIELMLVSRGLVTVADVERARTARIYSAFREMMAWTSGRFSFDPGVPISTNPAIALSAQTILMHIYQEQDEQNR